MSQSPGMRYFPRASMILASFGICALASFPTAAIRCPSMTTVMSGCNGFPVALITFTCLKTAAVLEDRATALETAKITRQQDVIRLCMSPPAQIAHHNTHLMVSMDCMRFPPCTGQTSFRFAATFQMKRPERRRLEGGKAMLHHPQNAAWRQR